MVLGKNKPGDGGGGIYTFDSTRTSVDNSDSVVRPIGYRTSQGAWVRETSGPADVRRQGAIGDGETDDHAALVASLSAGDHVRLYGQHRLASDFNVPDGKVLYFDQGGTLVVDAGKSITGRIALAGPPPTQLFGGLGTMSFALDCVGPVDVRWFGAKCDGTHDDAAAIQAAIRVATGYDADTPGSAATRSGAVRVPMGTCVISKTIRFVGAGGFHLTFSGDSGGNFGAPYATQLLWRGTGTDTESRTMFVAKGMNCATFENIDFDGAGVAECCFIFTSNQPAGGSASDGCVWRKCSFLNVSSTADSVCFKVGTGTLNQQSADSRWIDCKFFANQYDGSVLEAAACWRTDTSANTKDFAFEGCFFSGARFGIDWQYASGRMVVEQCQFATFGGTSRDGGGAGACIIVAGTGNALVVRGCEVECYPELIGRSGGAYFIAPGSGGSAWTQTSLTVEACQVSITLPSNNIIVCHGGKIMLSGNQFLGGFGSASPNQNAPCIGLAESPEISTSNSAQASCISFNNFYAGLSDGAFAPIVRFDGGGGSPPVLAGLGSIGAVSRLSIFSFGDTSFTPADDPSPRGISLQPWFGTLPVIGPCTTVAPTWSTNPLPHGAAAVAILTTWHGAPIGGFVSAKDAVLVSCDAPIPPGVIIQGAVNIVDGVANVTLTALNLSGAQQTLAGDIDVTLLSRSMQ